MMKRRILAPLIKRDSGSAQKGAQSDTVDDVERPEPLRKRRAPVKVACGRCRQKKVQCDGQRPTCTTCIASKTDCYYDKSSVDELRGENKELKDSLQAATSLLDHLQSVSEEEAVLVLRRLRASQSRRLPSPQQQPSTYQYIRGILPPNQPLVEFELTALHSLVYPALEPIGLPEINFNSLEVSSRSEMPNLVAVDDLPKLKPVLEDSTIIAPFQLTTSPPMPLSESSERSPLTAGQSPPLRWCDPRLNRLDVAFWTKAPISNNFAAGAISTYLETDHALLGFFDADLFLSDLVEQRLRYCSPFLVSSLLCMACLCYTKIDARASALSHIFQQEAERLWAAYRSSNTITELSATMLLSIACIWLGKEKLGQDLLTHGHNMAERLRFFGSPEVYTLESQFLKMTPDEIRATSHAAWGCYGYVTVGPPMNTVQIRQLAQNLMDLRFHATMYGGEPVTCPPVLPLPGQRNSQEVDISNTQWPAHPLPAYMGYTFTAMCRLWSIVQEVLAFYHSPKDIPIAERVSLSFAEHKYQKLLSWADTLTSELAHGSHSPLHVYIFHTMYHIAVLNIFRPLLKTLGSSRLPSFASLDSSPNTIFNASYQQLKRLLIKAKMRPSYSIQSGLLNPAVMHITNIILAHADPQDWRGYFFFCMSFWVDAAPSFPVLADIAQGYVSLALHNGSLSAQEAKNLRKTLAKITGFHKVNEGSSVIVDFDGSVECGTVYRANELAQRFDEDGLFDEFTTGNVDEAQADRGA